MCIGCFTKQFRQHSVSRVKASPPSVMNSSRRDAFSENTVSGNAAAAPVAAAAVAAANQTTPTSWRQSGWIEERTRI